MELFLYRQYHLEGTNGVLVYNNSIICYTIELPWLQNRKMVSCIPEGRYQLVKRFSPRHQHHLLVHGVPNRTLILIHRANNAAKELKGCIAPVTDLVAPGKGKASAQAFKLVMRLVFASFSNEEPVWLQITKLPADSSSLNIQ